MKAALRTVTAATVMAAVASAMLLAVGGDSGTPSRFELDPPIAPTSAGPAADSRPATETPNARERKVDRGAAASGSSAR